MSIIRKKVKTKRILKIKIENSIMDKLEETQKLADILDVELPLEEILEKTLNRVLKSADKELKEISAQKEKEDPNFENPLK